MTAQEVVQATKQCLPDCPIPGTECSNKLKSCDLTVLQTFTAWCRLKGLPWEVLGPTLVHKRDRTALYAGLTGQRYAAQSSRGLGFLLPPGLGKEEHCKRSLSLPTPFAPRDWPELDVSFALDGIRVWRGALPRWTQRLRNALRLLASALAPVETALTRWRVPSSLRVAASKQPAFNFLAAISVLTRWPDLSQGQELVLGHPIVGEISPSGVFRAVRPKGSTTP